MNKYNAFIRKPESNYEVYASIVGKPVQQIHRYLTDVQNLEGKLPDGTFKGRLSSQQLELLDGFKDETLDLYLSILPEYVAERVNHNSKNNSIRRLPSNIAGSELRLCRELAIKGALTKLIPNFENIFESKIRRGRKPLVQAVCSRR